MPLAQFSPNKNLTGGAVFWKRNPNGGVTATVFKQIAFNDDKKNNFDFTTGIGVKFSSDEIGGIISAVRTSTKFNFYHQFEKNGVKTVSNGNFSYYNLPAKVEGKPNFEGFGLTVTKDGSTVKVAYTLGGAESLMEFLKFVLRDEFAAIVDEDATKDAEFSAKRNQEAPQAPALAPAKKAVAPVKPKAQPKPAPVEAEPEVADVSAPPSETDNWFES